jgi:hypothetical protein
MTAPARRQGFARGDFDTSFPLDDKFLELRGRLDALHYYAAVGAYWTIVAAAWREADRKPGCRTVPDAVELLADLASVGLLDSKQVLKSASYRRWIGKALDSRKSDSVRKARNRAGMSRVTPPDDGVTPTESTARARQGRVGKGRDGRDGESPVIEGGAGGDSAGADDDGRRDLEAWLLVRFRPPTPAQRRFLDTYCRVFDATGPERAERLILANPDDPIAALKADLQAFRAERSAEAAAQESRPRAPRRPGGLSSVNAELARMFAQHSEEQEQDRIERIERERLAGLSLKAAVAAHGYDPDKASS